MPISSVSASSISLQPNVRPADSSRSKFPTGTQLDPEQQKKVEELKKRDAEVRRHEQAHLAAAGPYAKGGAHYEYETGPDGRRYAVGGEVDIDTSKVPGDPEATIRKAQTIKRAALAPADPSPQDRRVAVQADRMASEARQELAQKNQEEGQGYGRDGRRVIPASEFAIVDVVI